MNSWLVSRLLALKGSVLGLANDEKEASTFSIKLRAGAAGTAVAFDVEVELSVHGAAETLQLAADDVEEHKDRTQVRKSVASTLFFRFSNGNREREV